MKAVTLRAESDHGQKGQFVAYVVGIDRANRFRRTRLGKDADGVTEVAATMSGLYQCQNVRFDGVKVSAFFLVGDFAGQLSAYQLEEPEARRVAKELESGRQLDRFIGFGFDGWHFLGVELLHRKALEMTKVDVIQVCWQSLDLLGTVREAADVLAELRRRLEDKFHPADRREPRTDETTTMIEPQGGT